MSNQLLFALKNEKLISIEDVNSGKSCDCVCPYCKGKLIAKKGKIKSHHFAHISTVECKYGYETSLHLLAKEIIQQTKSFTLPRVEINYLEKRKINISEPKEIIPEKVHIEKWNGNIKPDIIIEINGKFLAIEIFVTHRVDDIKLEKLKLQHLSTIEINLSELNSKEYTSNELYKEIEDIINSKEDKRKYWIYNFKQENYINENLDKLKKQFLNRYYTNIVFCNNYNAFVDFNNQCKNCKNLLKINDHHILCVCKKSNSTLNKAVKMEFPTGDNDDAFIYYCPNEIYKIYKYDEKPWYVNKKITDCFKCNYFMGLDIDKEVVLCKMADSYKKYEWVCPNCKSKLLKKNGKNGEFIGCSNYPKCKYTRDIIM